MKKTLKVLMAIILFAVVLAIATSVNAATNDYPVAEEVVTSSQLSTLGYLKDGKLDLGKVDDGNGTMVDCTGIKTLKVDSTISIDLDGKAIDVLEVVNGGNITLTNSGATVTLPSIEVKEGGNFTLDSKNVKAATIESEGNTTVNKGTVTTLTVKKGTVTLGNKAVVATLDTDISLNFSEVNIANVKVNETDATVVITDNTATKKPVKPAAGSDADIVLLSVKDHAEYEIFTNKSNVKFTLTLKDENGKTVTGTEKGEYAMILKAFYNDIELGENVTATAKTAGDSTEYIEVNGTMAQPNTSTVYPKLIVKKPLNNKTVYVAPAIATKITNADQKITIAIPVSATVEPTATPTAEPTATPTATPDTDNGDLDETPKTGDHIIPATAILAVVVVANVVYFAKMKRN